MFKKAVALLGWEAVVAFLLTILLLILINVSCENDTQAPTSYKPTMAAVGVDVNPEPPKYQYQWGQIVDPVEPSGELIAHSGCGGWDVIDAFDDPPEDSGCMIYEYDNLGNLYLTHQNAVFNCCPEDLVIEFNFSNDTIYIHEDETYGENQGCTCVCPYDVEMVVRSLPRGVYTVVLTGRHIYSLVEFTLDLTSVTSGYYCFNLYEWE